MKQITRELKEVTNILTDGYLTFDQIISLGLTEKEDFLYRTSIYSKENYFGLNNFEKCYQLTKSGEKKAEKKFETILEDIHIVVNEAEYSNFIFVDVENDIKLDENEWKIVIGLISNYEDLQEKFVLPEKEFFEAEEEYSYGIFR